MFVCIDGEFLPQESALISVFDHGLVTGDGAFEAIPVYDNRPFALGRHLRRLRRTLMGMLLDEPQLELISSWVMELIERNDLGNARVRLTVTAGDARLTSDRVGGRQRVIIAMEPAIFTSTVEPIKVAIAPWPRNERGALSGLKTTSYAENVLGLEYAHRAGASEVIFPNTKGELCEGSGSNIFVVVDGNVFTPTLQSGCLAGITREILVEELGVKEADMPIADLVNGTVTEAFLSSSFREVQPIATVDKVALAVVGGSVTKSVRERFAQLFAGDLDI